MRSEFLRNRTSIRSLVRTALLSSAFGLAALDAAATSDVTAPTARCKPYTLSVNCGQTTLTPAMVNDGSFDNAGGSGIKSMTVSPNSFSCSDAGARQVTLTVTDNDDNVSTCTTTVTVVCQKVTCKITVTPCASPYPAEKVGGPNSQPGSHYSATNPFYLYLGYGPQCVVLTGKGYGSNNYYANCWSEDPSNPAPNTLSCYINCASPTFAPTKPGLYTFRYTTYGTPRANNNCTPSLCASTCEVTICVKDINYAVNFGPGNGKGNGFGNNGKGKDGYYQHDEGNSPNPKVYICHVPKGNPGNTHVIYVSANAAKAHIDEHGGDAYYYYGPCESPCVLPNARSTARRAAPGGLAYENGELEVSLFPNPSAGAFRVNVYQGHAATADIAVYDLQGRIVEFLPEQTCGADISVGAKLAPGAYIINVMQAGESKRMQVTKL